MACTIKVDVREVPGRTESINLEAGQTIEDALDEAGMWPVPSGHEVRMNDQRVTVFETPLHSDANIYVTKQVKGN